MEIRADAQASQAKRFLALSESLQRLAPSLGGRCANGRAGSEFIVGGYDLKHAARLIFNSRVYQASPLSQKVMDKLKKAKQLAYGPARRRLTAEQTIDSLFLVAGKPMDVEPMSLDPEGSRPPEQFLHLGFPTRAWQLASTSTDRDRPALMLPAVQQVCDLMMSLGWRDSRPTPLTQRDESASPLQSLILGNGLSATKFARMSDNSRFTEMAWSAPSATDLLDRIFQTILSRLPNLQERADFLALLELLQNRMVLIILGEGFNSFVVCTPESAPEQQHPADAE